MATAASMEVSIALVPPELLLVPEPEPDVVVVFFPEVKGSEPAVLAVLFFPSRSERIFMDPALITRFFPISASVSPSA